MLKEPRHSLIIEIVDREHYASIHQLMKATASSESTIRNDLVQLEKEGAIIRLHGGAESIHKDSVGFERNMDEKSKIEVEAKKAVSRAASRLIKDDMLVYVDAGSTTSYIPDFMNAKGVIVVTNSVTIAKKFREKGCKVYVTGGEIKISTDAFIGHFAMEVISRFSFDVGFFGTNGISIEEGFTTPDYEEAIVKEAAIKKCKESYILSDKTKLGVVTAVKFAPFASCKVICDSVPASYKGHGIIEAK